MSSCWELTTETFRAENESEQQLVQAIIQLYNLLKRFVTVKTTASVHTNSESIPTNWI